VKAIILLSLLCCAASGLAQNCDSFLVVKKDKFTDVQEVAMMRPVIKEGAGNGTLTLQVLPTRNKSIVLDATVKSASFGCTDEKGMLYFIFDNKEKISLHNQAKINCKGQSLVYVTGGLASKELRTLMQKKKITAIRITSREDSFEVDLDEREGTELHRALNCMLRK
jgi:hypothetical protein